jgi:translocator protein
MRYLPLFGFIALVAAISGLSSLATMPAVTGWYQHIQKPFWTPPDYVFGPVWTLLYLMIAVSGWLVWDRLPGTFMTRLLSPTLRVYWVQLSLNFLWSILFFGLQHPVLALADILALLAAIAITIRVFLRIRRVAGFLLVPYLLWVGYATSLNAGIVALN